MNQMVFCIECQKYFKNEEDFKKNHNKVSYKIKNVNHNYLIEGNMLAYISNIMMKNFKLERKVEEQKIEIMKLKNEISFLEDSLKNNDSFHVNINLKNIENKIFGKCLIHFLPKTILFYIDYNGEIIFNGRKEFELEILFPFKKAEIKFSSIEKLQGCISSKKVQNITEQEIIIYNNYSSAVNQKNKIVSIKLLRNYFSPGFLEKNKINISLNGILTFSDIGYDLKKTFILYNINYRQYLSYENYKWVFIENCFTKDGNIKIECIINLELKLGTNEICIRNKYKTLEISQKEEQNEKFHFQFLNQFYGIITIFCKDKYLSCEINNKTQKGSIKLTNELNYFIIVNN